MAEGAKAAEQPVSAVRMTKVGTSPLVVTARKDT
jgi:hypothetical protein